MHILNKSLQSNKDQASNVKATNCRCMLYRILFYAIVFIAIFILVYPICPLYDDWYYATAPNPSFTASELLPGSTFWRPFDVLFGAFMAFIPSLFPALNRAVVILSHIVNAALIGSILTKLGVDKKWRIFGICYFLFSSATWAVTTSPDALNQSFSVLFGLIAIYLHLKKGGYWFLFWCSIALLTKESGVSWFFVIVILDAILSESSLVAFFKNRKLLKRAVIQTLLSVALIGVYFAVRFSLYGSITLGGGSGRYDISLLSFSTIKNFVLLFASAASGVDSIALLSNTPSLPLAALTLILSLVFLAVILICTIKMLRGKKDLFSLSGLLLIMLGLAAPMTILGNAGEMHAYPVLCAAALLFAFCLDRAQVGKKQLIAALLCIFVSFAISSAHKLITIYDFSDRTITLTENLREQYTDPSESVLFVELDAVEGYSIFNQTALKGSSYGLSLRPYYSWAKLDHSKYLAKSKEDALLYIETNEQNFDCIFIVQGETVERIK